MNWTDFLKPGERRTLDAIKARQALDNDTKRKIYDRCRHRLRRATKREQQNVEQNFAGKPQKS